MSEDDPLGCLCGRVSEGENVAAIAAGARTVSEVSARTGSGTACGDCAEDVEELLAEAGDMDEQVSPSSARAGFWNVSASTSSTPRPTGCARCRHRVGCPRSRSRCPR